MSYDQFDPSSHGQDAATREQGATPPDGSASVAPNADDSGTSVGDPAREHSPIAERLHAVFEQSPLSTIIYDVHGSVLAVNPAFERLWETTLAEIPADYSILTDPQLEAAGVLPAVRRAFVGEAVTLPPLLYEVNSAGRPAQSLWIQAYLFPVRATSGAIEQIVLIHEDVSARRADEAARAVTAARAAKLQTLSAALSVASTVDEVAQVVVRHATEVLDAAGTVIARLTADAQELEIMRAGAMPDHIRDEWRRFAVSAPVPLADVARTGSAIFLESREEWTARYPDLVPLLDVTGQHANAVMPLVVDGRVLGVLGAAFNTPRAFDEQERALARGVALQCAQALERARLFEAESEARREAEAGNQAKAQFLAVMSHELRTPLNVIGGYADLLEMGLRGPVTAEQREDLRRIRVSQRHLLGLINEVLTYAKIETGMVRYDMRVVPVRDALVAAEALVASEARAMGVTLMVDDCPPDLAVRADGEKVQQILVNLLSNAIKLSERGHRVELSCEAAENHARIHVRDSGIGIDADQLEVIFEPLVQARADLTRTAGGAGLRLAVSRDLARAMGGDLTVRSTVGVGTTLTLSLERA